jgi:hypothetical protein
LQNGVDPFAQQAFEDRWYALPKNERHNDKQHGHYKSAVCVAGETALCERR